MEMLLNILTWNVRGIMSSAYSLSYMLSFYNVDIALITEHKLMHHSQSFFDSIDKRFSVISTISKDIDPYSRASCGKGGVGIMYRKQLNCTVSPIDTIESDRIAGIEIRSPTMAPLYIFCVYLPADNNIRYFQEVLSELQAIVSFYCTEGNVICEGDFNAQYSPSLTQRENENYKSRYFTDFVCSNNCTPINKLDCRSRGTFTYTPAETMIDYFLADETLVPLVRKCEILDDTRCVIPSDHLPIPMKIDYDISISSLHVNRTGKNCIQWHKITSDDISAYSDCLANNLMEFDALKDVDDAAVLVESLTNAIHKSAESTLRKSTFNSHAKPYWTTQLKEAHAQAR